MSKPSGGPAFRVDLPRGIFTSDELDYYKGMTLRDYFAAQALGVLHSQMASIFVDTLMPPEKIKEPKDSEYSEKRINLLAETSYLIADAMIKERDK
jgi:hypothetical protein